MPLIVANLIRVLIQATVQTALFIGVSKLIEPLIDGAKKAIKVAFDMTDEEAEDSIANEIIDAFAMIGILGIGIKSKLPTKAAEKLGFTSKGYSKRKVSSKLKGSAGKAAKASTSKAKATSGDVETIAEAISARRGISVGTIKSLFNYTLTLVGLTTGFFFALAQYIDFANWQGPYQKFFQKILGTIGINPDTPIPKANTVSDDVWKRIYAVVEELKPLGLSFPFEGADRPYTRQNLVDLVNSIAANQQLDGVNPTYKTVIAVLLPLVQLSKPANDGVIDKYITKKVGAPTGEAVKSPVATPTIKVFTGVVSQGALGQGLTFQERQDDLIENMDELRQASSNNLAPFLAALPSRVRYEIKVVSSITTKDGFTQKGTAQQVKTGTYQNGQPKYKTVVNKFAVMDLYIFTDRNTKTKITTIVLGPTNAVTFQPGLNDLNNLAQELPKLITTQDVNEVSNITNVINNNQEANKVATEPTYQKPEDELNDTGFRFYKFTVNGETYFEILPWAGNIPSGHTMITKQEYLDQELLLTTSNPNRWKAFFEQNRSRNPSAFTTGKSGYVIKDGIPFYVGNGSVNDTINSVTSASSESQKAGSNASTLSEWYQSQGQALPSVSERSVIYERLGLGPSSFYTGTSEQNTKLLNALKYK